MVRKKEITSNATEKEEPTSTNWGAAMISTVIIKETGAASTSHLVACTTL